MHKNIKDRYLMFTFDLKICKGELASPHFVAVLGDVIWFCHIMKKMQSTWIIFGMHIDL